MANQYFQFRRFTVCQDRTAMKVGTDGTLLGAWAEVGEGSGPILDLGTGTGLIALMMAQRFPDAQITGIDIDADAVEQARENVTASPFSDRIQIFQADATAFALSAAAPFSAIVCNPPFFVDALTCPDQQRTTARHAETLTYSQLMAAAWRLLADNGELSVVIPFDCKAKLESEAALRGFFKSRECAVKTTPRKPARRFLLAFRKHPSAVEQTEGVIETSPGQRSAWYESLTRDFYL